MAIHRILFVNRAALGICRVAIFQSAEARDEAIRRVGLDALEQAERDPWIAQILQQNTEVYRDLRRMGPQMPKILLGGTSVMNGIPRDTAALIQALQPYVALD
jgi:hypothetical protein